MYTNLTVFLIFFRCRTRYGVSILGVEDSTSSHWSIESDVNARGTVATVTANRRRRKRSEEDWKVLENSLGGLEEKEERKLAQG
jgi:hypothetical protein